MRTRRISLTPEQDAFISELLEAGEYEDASEAIRHAIGALQQRRADDERKLKKLRRLIEQGIDDIDRGNYTEVDEEDLDAFLDSLIVGPRG